MPAAAGLGQRRTAPRSQRQTPFASTPHASHGPGPRSLHRVKLTVQQTLRTTVLSAHRAQRHKQVLAAEVSVLRGATGLPQSAWVEPAAAWRRALRRETSRLQSR